MIRVMIADDHPIVRAGLRQILSDDPEIRIVDEAGSGGDVLARLDSRLVDVLVLDISMPGLPFEELLHRLSREHGEVRILILSIHPEDQYALQALRSGAAGYLTKSQSPDRLVQAIHTIAAGQRYVTPTVADILVQALGASRAEPLHTQLTARETEVLLLLGSGHSTKAAATRLGLSPKTISTHRSAILRKLDLRGTADLMRYCMQNGLVR